MSNKIRLSLATTLSVVGLSLGSVTQASTPAIQLVPLASGASVMDSGAAASAKRAQNSLDEIKRFYNLLDDSSHRPTLEKAKNYAKTAHKAAHHKKRIYSTKSLYRNETAQCADSLAEAAADATAASAAALKATQFAKVAQNNHHVTAVLPQATAYAQQAQLAANEADQAFNQAVQAYASLQSDASGAVKSTSAAASKATSSYARALKAGGSAGDLIFYATPQGAKYAAESKKGRRLLDPTGLDLLTLEDLDLSPKRRWWVEVGVSGGVSNDVPFLDHYGLDSAPVFGADVTIGRDIGSSKFSLNLRANYFAGDSSSSDEVRSADYDLSGFMLMPGVRYRERIADNLYFFAGFNIGMASFDITQNINHGGTVINYSGDQIVFGSSIDVGVDYRINERMKIFANYYFFGVPNAPAMKQSTNVSTYTSSFKPDNMFMHTLRCGVRYSF